MSNDRWEFASTTTDHTYDCHTPTHTTMSDGVKDEDDTSVTATPQPVEHHPKPNKSFMIRTRNKPHHILTIEDGKLHVVSKPSLGGGWLWHCIKKSNWYGFVNAVSGTYLGHNNHGKIQAFQPHHLDWEFFMTDRHEDGGYVLLTWHGNELLQVAIGDDGKSLVEEKVGGTVWDFIEADFVRIPYQVYIPEL